MIIVFNIIIKLYYYSSVLLLLLLLNKYINLQKTILVL